MGLVLNGEVVEANGPVRSTTTSHRHHMRILFAKRVLMQVTSRVFKSFCHLRVLVIVTANKTELLHILVQDQAIEAEELSEKVFFVELLVIFVHLPFSTAFRTLLLLDTRIQLLSIEECVVV